MNSKLDDFDANMQYQSESSGTNDADRIARQIDDLRKAVSHFEDKLDSHRENARDVEQIVNAAAAVDDFLFQNPQSRRVTDDWQAIRRQIDRVSNQYGVTNDWDRGGSNTTTRSNSGNYGRSTSTTTTGGGVSAGARIIPPPIAVKGGNSRVRQPAYNGGNNNLATGLAGTYTLDRAQTENIDDVVASSGASAANQADLKDKLNAPDQIAIDIRGNQVTLATSNASPVSFTADGRDKVENVNGRSVKMRATLSGDKLVISSLGGETDFTVTFTATAGGQQLKVSRRMTTDYLSQTVFAESVYNKTDNQARLGISQNDPGSSSYPTTSTPDNDPVVTADNSNVPSSDNNTSSTNTTASDPNGGYSDNDQGNATIANGGTGGNGGYNNPTPNRTGSNPRRSPQPSAVYVKPGNYVVPDGSMITGLLENEINTKLSQNGDRFRLTVQSPNEYRGAVIEGFVSNIQRSGKMTGSAAVTFNFEKITLSDGQTYDFAGTLRTAADSVGRAAKVDNEGTVRGDSQTNKTAKRSGIGAGLGALIGLIAGGGHGAAIGAIIGGGGGAGSVYFEDRKDVMLNQGSTLTVQAAAPSK